MRARVSAGEGRAAALRRAAVFDALSDGVFETDERLVILDANDAFCRIVGLVRETLIGTSPPYRWWPADLAAPRPADADLDSLPTEVAVRRPDGSVRVVVLTVVTARDPASGASAGVVGTLRDVTEARAAETERVRLHAAAEAARSAAEAEADRARALADTAIALARPLSRLELANAVLEQADRLMPSDSAAFVLRDPVEGDAVVLAGRGTRRRPFGTSERYPIETRLPSIVAMHEGVVVVAEQAAEVAARFPGLTPITGARGSFVAVPVLVDGVAAASFVLTYAHERRFAGAEVDTLLALAAQCGQAIDRIELLEKEQREKQRHAVAAARTRRLQRLTHVLAQPRTVTATADVLVREAREAAQASRAALYAYDAASDALRLAASAGQPAPEAHEASAASHPVVARALGERQVQVAKTDAARPPAVPRDRLLAVLPLYDEHAVRGALVLGYDARAALGPVDEDVTRFLALVAGQATLALDRARLYSSERRARERAELLERVAAGLSAAVTQQEIARSALEDGFARLGATAGTVALLDPSGSILTALARFGHGADRAPSTMRNLEDDLPGPRAIRRGAPEFLSEAEVAERYPASANPWVRPEALAVFPLRSGPRATGFVSLWFPAGHGFAQDDREVLSTMSSQLSEALERARLFELERERRRRSDLLAALGVALDLDADLEERLGRIARLFVPELGDACMVNLLDDGLLRAAAIVHVDPHLQDVFRKAEQTGGIPPRARVAASAAIQEGRELVVLAPPGRDAFEEELRGTALDPALAGRWSPGERAVVPLVARDRPVGSFHLARAVDAPPLSAEDIDLLTEVGRRLAISIDATRLFDLEQRARTRAEEAERRSGLLARLSTELDAEPTRDARYERLLELLVPELADFASIEVSGRRGRALPVAVRHTDPDRLDALRALRERHALPPGARHSVARVLGTRRYELIQEIDASLIDRLAPTPESVELLREVDPASILILALVAHERVLGAVLLGMSRTSGRRFTEADVPFAQQIASRAALSLENALLLEREHEIAGELQRALLPSRLAETEHVAVAARYRPTDEHLDVGGDWFDVIELPGGRLGVAVGDVLGHGVRSAAVMGQLRSALAALAPVCTDPADVLRRLDTFAETVEHAEFATVCYAEIDPEARTMRYAVAGHPPPLAIDADGNAGFLEGGRSTPLLGLDRSYHHAEASLAEGMRIVLYTDGLVERRGWSIDEGLELLAETAAGLREDQLEDMTDGLLRRMTEFGQVEDDVALLCVELTGHAAVRLHLRLAADPPELARLRAAMRSFAEEHGLDPELTHDLLLATGEVVSNAIEHAYEGGRHGEVSVRLELTHGACPELVVRVGDRGSWRDRASDVDRGRGLTIARTIMDEIAIAAGSEGTAVTMRLALPDRIVR
jgi:PAS domain S-box-containing protein